MALGALGAVAAITVAGCTLSRTVAIRVRPESASAPRADGPGRTFLAVSTLPWVMHPARRLSHEVIVRYPEHVLQLRSLRTGRVIRTLLRSVGDIKATARPDGDVIAAESFGCKARLLRINPVTGRKTVIGALPEPVLDVALSPDGTRLAFITTQRRVPRSCTPVAQPRHPVTVLMNPGGPEIGIPATGLAIFNLGTRAIVTTRHQSAARSALTLAWSPDGRRIAVTAGATALASWPNVVELLSAARPDVRTARTIRPPRRCAFTIVAWPTSGLVAGAQCPKADRRNRPRFVRLSPAGRIAFRWPRLPGCTDGVQAFTLGARVLVAADLRVSDGKPCGVRRPGGDAVRLLELQRAGFAPVATFRKRGLDLAVAGW